MTSIILDRISNSLLCKELEQKKYDTNTLSHRLKLCLRQTNMSQSELARLINVKPQIIQYLCTKSVKSSKFTYELADALGVDYTWLSTGDGAMRQHVEDKVEERKIPLFLWSDLDKVMNTDNINSYDEEFIISSTTSSGNLIASKIDDTSMEPRFEKGTTIIIDLDDSTKPGDFVLVKLHTINSWVFREFIHKVDNTIELSPINKSLFKDVLLTPEDRILGVLVQTICDFKRDRD
jgi:phage repressor protein C with HTH and peptisase S24 domain